MRELELSNNRVEDSGLMLLSPGLESHHMTLVTLRLSGCLITEEGFSSLASALSSNPSCLRELDLSYNHPGDSGGSCCLLDWRIHWRLDTLRYDRTRALLLCYTVQLPAMLDAKSLDNPRVGLTVSSSRLDHDVCELSFDSNTATSNLKLSDSNRKVTRDDEDPDEEYMKYPMCERL
ncbi:Ribonuclease inhibitor [Liparis tanakae]|uniref:Ribonuclease inhibitor n=1 Tax=Liparis tanakae TaxID=230148 RepID=A0A4Z2FSV9_9TELE|nr:Ribonuclease inhibitor [Liparis tanakae]